MAIDSSLDQLLEESLQELAHSGDVDAVLQRHAEHADELRPLLGDAQALRRYYASVPQPPQQLARGRARMLAQVDQLRQRVRLAPGPSPTPSDRRPKMFTTFAGKLVGLLVAVTVGLAALGTGGALAAAQSLPGDALYAAKLGLEDLRLEAASAPEQRLELALRYADRRVAEIEALDEANRGVTEGSVARTREHLQLALQLAAQVAAEDAGPVLERILQRTQAQVGALEQLQDGAQEHNQAQIQNALQICQQVRAEVANGLQDPQAFRTRYQQRTGMPEDVTPPEPSSDEPGQGAGAAGEGQGQQQGGDQSQQQEQNQQQGGNESQQQQQDQQQDGDQPQQQEQNQQQGGEQSQQQEQDQQQGGEQSQQQEQNQQQGGQQEQSGQQHGPLQATATVTDTHQLAGTAEAGRR